LQRVSRSHGLHWRTVVLGRALPPRALRARAATCVYVTTHPGPVESAPDSCQRPALTQDFVPEGSRHQRLLSPFLGRESAAISSDEAIFIHPAAPLLPQHVHVAATLRGTFHWPAHYHCRSSWISGSACWAANNWPLKFCTTSSVQSWAAWTAHALPSTSRPHCVQLFRDSASALPCRRPAQCSTSKSLDSPATELLAPLVP
ncbi:hypothetical protein T03_2423, partial [Trichinella britovi]